MRRAVHCRGRSRADMSDGCPKTFDLAFAWWILSDRRMRLSGVLAMLRNAEARGVRVEVLRSAQDIARLLDALPAYG